MERELRRKFIRISFCIVLIVISGIACILNISNYFKVDNQADQIVTVIAENDGLFPNTFDTQAHPISEETPYSTRFFTVKLDEFNNIISTNTSNIQLVNTETANEYALDILDTNSTSGYVDHYKYQVVDTEYGNLLIFIDCEEELAMFYTFLQSSILICSTALMLVFVLLVFLSQKAIAPIVESYQKQQQFITNITHELKTPLAIIKTNTEVIEIQHSSSEWSRSIHNQISRLNELINYLISLSKLEEGAQSMLKVDFSISDAVNETVEPFKLVAYESGKTLETSISPNLTYCGDEQAIRLLISTLMDNALKYSSTDSTIQLLLKTHKNKIIIETSNEANDLHIGKYDVLFDRFYRIDSSRNSKKGGFGIGLAIASSIVTNHNGTIKADSLDGKRLRFLITL